MQAADLLAVIAPAAQGKGGPFAAQGKGAGLFGVSEGQGADGAQGAQGIDAFSQALAALLAASGQLQQQAQAQTAAPAADGEGETADAAADTPAKGKAAALFAAQVKGQAKAADDAAPATATEATPTDAAAADTAATPVAEGEVAAATAAEPTPAHSLPANAKADEALARRLADPPPRSERAQDVAKGPHLPPWAAPAAPVAEPAAETIPATPATPAEATPVTPTTETAPEATAALAGQTQLAAAAPQVQAKGDGKSKGKTDLKVDAKARGDEPPGLAHGPRGVGKGLETAPGQLKKDDDTSLEPPVGDIQSAESETPTSAQTDGSSLMAADQSRTAAPVAAAHVDAKAAAHTVAHLASQILAKSDGSKSTRFDVQLDPAGLGKVDVKIEISRGGEISAAMSFDNPQAAAELRSRAGELRTALEQAGFDLSKGGLSFDFSGQGGGHQLWDQQADTARPSWSRASFTDLSLPADVAAPASHRTIDAGGVDVTV